MTCKINADTSDGLKIVSDTSGAVDIQSNGTTKVSIDSSGNISTVAGMSTSNGNIAPLRPNTKPLIINGDMNIAQRATSVTGHTGGGYTTLDRWRLDVNTLGTWTIAKTASAPDGTGLTSSFRIDCTTADASPAAGDHLIFSTRLEGQDSQLLEKGTSAAKKVTIAFYVKSNKTGTYIMEIDDNDNARNINQAYTISSADTWEKKVLTFDGDTTGAFGNDNGDSLRLLWWLGAGSNFTSGSLQTAWAGTDNTKRAVGNVNVGDNTANDWSITGIQMEVGEYDATTIPSFQHESFDENLRRCQRYFRKIDKEADYGPIMMAHGIDNNRCRGAYFFPTPMRSAPTFTATGDMIRSFGSATAMSSAAGVSSRFAMSIDFTNSGAFAVNQGNLVTFKTTAASLTFTSEL
jgi:hypothetical protein